MKELDIFEENKRLRDELEQEKRLRSDWQEKYYELLNELKKTQALLRQFLNENTPSSKLPFKYPSKEQSERESKPRGKPEGSNGGNKEAPERVDRKIKAKLEGGSPKVGKIIRGINIDNTRVYG